jgi:serine/threonine protein kinase
MFKKLFGKSDKDKEKEKEKGKPSTPAAGAGRPENPASPTVKEEKLTKDDFESLDVLGKGSFAHVVLAKRTSTGKYYAMKVVTKQGLLDHKRVGDVFTERNVLTRSNHPYLLKLHWTFQSEHKLFFVMDYMPGGDLDKYMNSQPTKALDLFTSKLYGAEILLAITYLHDHGVIYRDLKPENILISGDGHCALADFGLSKDFHKEGHDLSDEDLRANSFVGSPFYVAPDVLKQKEYTLAVDFWSFGILLYRMLCGKPPFSGRSMKEVFDNILFSDLRFPSSVPLSAEAKDLISRLLTKDAAKRIKGPEVKAHPFWQGISFDEVMAKRVAPPNWVTLPTVEQMLAQKEQMQAKCGGAPAPSPGNSKEPPKQPGQVVNTLPGSSALQPGQQKLFENFSCTADNALHGGQ